jgi:hypothetical protein
MHFMDPKALAGLHVIGSRNVKLGIVEGVYADIRSVMSHKEEANRFRYYGIGYGAARPLAGKPIPRGQSASGRTRGAGRTMLHRYAAPAVNHTG